MSNASLIQQLETLREQYNQRQRSVQSMINMLKTANDTLVKAHKGLRDFAENNPELANNSLMVFNESRLKADGLDPILPDLRRELKTLLPIGIALKDALAALRLEPPDVVKLGKAVETLQSIKTPSEALTAVLPELIAALAEAEKALGTTFAESLRDAFRVLGIEVVGQPPNIEVGRFLIQLNFPGKRANLFYGIEPVGKAPLSVEATVKAWQAANKTITGRNEKGELWIAQLYEAWKAARGEKPETRVNIVECYFEMVMIRQKKGFRAAPGKHGFVDYSRAQFAYDLDLFINQQHLTHAGLRPALHVAIKSTSDNPEKSLKLIIGSGPGDGGYVGDFEFKPID